MSGWWITTDILARGGVKVLGPFETQELALTVRTLKERAERTGITYWVDEEEDDADAPVRA